MARALELEGIATTLASFNPGMTQPILPPRALYTKFSRGATLGEPNNSEQQMKVLRETLMLLSKDAPLDPSYL